MKKRKKVEAYEILTVPFQTVGQDVTDGALLGLPDLGENQFRGMASVFGRVVDAFTPTIMQRGAFTKTLQERSRSIPILWQHDMWQPIGKPVLLEENDRGLMLQAEISRTSLGRDVLTLMRDGVVNALSIGFEPVLFDYDQTNPEEPLRYVREARLVEVSVVTLGADPNALISEVRSGYVAGCLEQYRIGHDETFSREETTEDAEPVTQETLGQQLDAFSAEYLTINPEATVQTILTAFHATFKAEPSTETLTLDPALDLQLASAELWLAESSLENL